LTENALALVGHVLLGFAGVDLGGYRALNPFGRHELDGDAACVSASGELSAAWTPGWDTGLVFAILLNGADRSI
jgi:hypothetical protein